MTLLMFGCGFIAYLLGEIDIGKGLMVFGILGRFLWVILQEMRKDEGVKEAEDDRA